MYVRGSFPPSLAIFPTREAKERRKRVVLGLGPGKVDNRISLSGLRGDKKKPPFGQKSINENGLTGWGASRELVPDRGEKIH